MSFIGLTSFVFVFAVGEPHLHYNKGGLIIKD